MDPDDAAELLDPIVKAMIRSVHQFGGRVISVDGDGIKAVFGAEGEQEDHAIRAVLSGQETIKRLASLGENNSKPPLPIRIGLHSGYVIVRWQDRDFGGGLDLIGNVAHLCVKIENAGRPNIITLSRETLHLIEDYFDCTERKPSLLDLPLYEVIGGKPPKLRELNFIDQQRIRLIGRDNELDYLMGKIGVDAQMSAYIGLVGEAGLGKTRLLSEIYVDLIGQNITAIILDTLSVNSDSPFHSLGAFTRKILALYADLATSVLSVMNRKDGDIIGQGFELLLYPERRNHLMKSMQPEDCLISIQSAISHIFEKMLTNNRLVLFVEDVHFLDRESFTCLEYIANRFRGTELSIVFSTRPEGVELVEKITLNQLVLEPVSQQAAKDLLVDISGEKILKNPKVIHDIIQRSQGVPIALVEFGRNFASQSEHIATDQLPISLEPLLRQKIDRLSPSEKNILDIASVIGIRSQHEMIRELLGWKTEELLPKLRQLYKTGTINDLGDGAFAFSHKLLQEACYNAMPRTTTSKLHKDVYAFLLNCDDTEQQLLAFHAEKSGQLHEALTHLEMAVDEAVIILALETVRSLYYRVVKICQAIGQSQTYETKLRLAEKCYPAFQQLSHEAELLELFEDALERAVNLSDVQSVRLLGHISTIKMLSGASDTYDCAAMAMEKAEKQGSKALTARSSFLMANAEFVSGKPKAAANRLLHLLEETPTVFSRIKDPNSIYLRSAQVRIHASWYHYEIGAIDIAKRLAKEAKQIAITNDHLHSHLICDLNDGYFAYREGRHEDAVMALSQTYTLCMENMHYGFAPLVAAWSALAMTEIGDIDGAQAILSKELNINKAYLRRQNAWLFYLKQAQSNLALLKNENDKALSYLQDGLNHCQLIKDYVHEAYAHFELARGLQKLFGETSKSEKHFAEARRLAIQCEMRPLLEMLLNVTKVTT